MKKLSWVLLAGLTGALILGAPALAKTTSIDVDGQTYLFFGNQSRHEVDGKTFHFGEDSVRIQEPGKADRVYPLEQTQADDTLPIEGSSAAASEAVFFFTAEQAISITDSEYASEINRNDRFDQYAQFGLSYDADKDALYHQGKRVRLFIDAYPVGDAWDGIDGIASIEHFDDLGTIDVDAERDLTRKNRPDGSYDPSGLLTGLRARSDEEFAERDLTEWKNPRRMGVTQTATADSTVEMTPEEKRALYAPYVPLGIHYDEASDNLTYQGQWVRHFLDVQRSNGESFSGGRFQGSMTSLFNEHGTIDITIVRDYTKPDAQGDGALIGLKTDRAK